MSGAPTETAVVSAPRCRVCQKPLSWRDQFADTSCALVCRACRQRAAEAKLRGTWRPPTLVVKDGEGKPQQVIARGPGRKQRRQEQHQTPTQVRRQALLNARLPRHLRSLLPTH